MEHSLVNLKHLPSFLFFIIWVIFPLWLNKRRKQGLILLRRWDEREGSGRMGIYFELAVFIFAIPFTCFSIFVLVNFIVSYFIALNSARFKLAVEITTLIMDIALILYMYLTERKIHLDTLKKEPRSSE